jgi:hypothetical protein
MARPEVVARLMDGLRQGDQGAGRELIDLFYPELSQLPKPNASGIERASNTSVGNVSCCTKRTFALFNYFSGRGTFRLNLL